MLIQESSACPVLKENAHLISDAVPHTGIFMQSDWPHYDADQVRRIAND
jgi:hypothetical protein